MIEIVILTLGFYTTLFGAYVVINEYVYKNKGEAL